MAGGAGNDTYVFGFGDGHETIVDQAFGTATRTETETYTAYENRWVRVGSGENSYQPLRSFSVTRTREVEVEETVEVDGGSDRILFGEDVTISELLVERDGNDLIVGLDETSGQVSSTSDLSDRLTLNDWFSSENRIEVFEFANGVQLGVPSIAGLLTTDGNDQFHWSETALNADGGGGDDVLSGSESADVLHGGAGNDQLNGNGGDDVLDGGDGDDILNGSSGDDTLSGGSGSDQLRGGVGNDTYRFDLGDETINISETVVETHSRIENYQVTTYVNQRYWVNGGENGYWSTRQVAVTTTHQRTIEETVQVDAGNDTLLFGEGIELSDLVVERQGNDLKIGVNSNDNTGTTVSELTDQITITNWFDDNSRIETFEFADGTQLGAGGIYGLLTTDQSDTMSWSLTAFVADGGGGDDVLSGSEFADVLHGGAGNDQLNGNGGDDVLDGGTGDDILDGGTGDDILEGGAGNDVIHGGGGDDVIYTSMAGAHHYGRNTAYGEDGDDTITGTNGFDDLFGGSGKDILHGGEDWQTSETDRLYGGDGDDILISGFVGEDRTVNLHNGDVLDGGAGNDTLTGGNAHDTLIGGAGNDLIYGGAGDDTFVFSGSWGEDTILDFEDGSDVLSFTDNGDVSNFDDLTISQDGDNTIISIGDNEIILKDIAAGRITDDDVLFV